MTATLQTADSGDLVEAWPLPYDATLGSSVRSKGIFLEVRARLPVAAKKAITVKARLLTLRMPNHAAAEFAKAKTVIAAVLEGIERMPVIPREIEDILAIKTSERHRWLKDGRLPSAGTRTVKLRGRARAVTFHVFDPQMVRDVLDRALVDTWREEDVERAAENRRRAVWKAKLTRHGQSGTSPETAEGDEDRFKLKGWAEFERESLLR